MTRKNLEDTLKGLRKYHRGSPYLERVEKELANRDQGEWEWVKHQANETVRFEWGEKSASSHALVNALQRGSRVLSFYLLSSVNRALHGGRYVLHSE